MNNKKEIIDKFYRATFGEYSIEAFNINSEKEIERFTNNCNEKLYQTAYNLMEGNKAKEELNTFLEENINRISNKLTKAVKKLRGAILAERNTTSMVYSTILELDEENTDLGKTTAKIIDNIIVGAIPKEVEGTYITPLRANNIEFKNILYKSINKKVLTSLSDTLENFTIKNKTHSNSPVEFTINFEGAGGGKKLLVLKLRDLAILEIYINKNLVKAKELKDYYSLVVDTDTEEVTVISYPTHHKSTDLYFEMIGVTDFLYTQDSVYESKELSINRDLSELVLDVCDNAKEGAIHINYYVSINKQAYERLNPVSKTVSKYESRVQSINKLSKDLELNLIKVGGTKHSEGSIRFQIPSELQSFVEYETYGYILNRGISFNLEGVLYLLIKEDIDLNIDVLKLNMTGNEEILIDGELISSSSLLLTKGIRKLEWKATDLNYEYLVSILSSNNIFKNKLLFSVFKNIDGESKYISLSTPEILNLGEDVNNCEIYLKNRESQITVDTIKVKAELHSENKKDMPYISRILIRGI